MHERLENHFCSVGAKFDCQDKSHIQSILYNGFVFSGASRPLACYMVLLCFTSL